VWLLAAPGAAGATDAGAEVVFLSFFGLPHAMSLPLRARACRPDAFGPRPPVLPGKAGPLRFFNGQNNFKADDDISGAPA